MRIVAITQARMGSSRLPGKVLKEVNGVSLLELHVTRVLKSKMIDDLIVATTILPDDCVIVSAAHKLGIRSFQGAVDDVLDRFYRALTGRQVDYVVRLTADCPLIDPVLIDDVIRYAIDHDLDYCSNTLSPEYPDGQDVEVVKYGALAKAWAEAKLPSEREHVTPYLWKNSSSKEGSLFSSANFGSSYSFGHLRMTVDELHDLIVIDKMVEAMGREANWLTYASWLEENAGIRQFNETIKRNEGYDKSINREE